MGQSPTRTYAVSNFARDMLTVADNFQRAIDSVPAEARAAGEPALKALIEGVELTERDMLKTLERYGVKRIDREGQKFDPNLHQAMFEVPNPNVPNGTVIQVVQTGYVIGDRVLRPALVGVAKGGPKASAQDQASDETTGGTGEPAAAETARADVCLKPDRFIGSARGGGGSSSVRRERPVDCVRKRGERCARGACVCLAHSLPDTAEQACFAPMQRLRLRREPGAGLVQHQRRCDGERSAAAFHGGEDDARSPARSAGGEPAGGAGPRTRAGDGPGIRQGRRPGE